MSIIQEKINFLRNGIWQQNSLSTDRLTTPSLCARVNNQTVYANLGNIGGNGDNGLRVQHGNNVLAVLNPSHGIGDWVEFEYIEVTGAMLARTYELVPDWEHEYLDLRIYAEGRSIIEFPQVWVFGHGWEDGWLNPQYGELHWISAVGDSYKWEILNIPLDRQYWQGNPRGIGVIVGAAFGGGGYIESGTVWGRLH